MEGEDLTHSFLAFIVDQSNGRVSAMTLDLAKPIDVRYNIISDVNDPNNINNIILLSDII